MSKVNLIVAATAAGIIGVNNTIPWRSKADMKRFKSVTMGGALIMGRLTWDSLPKPLVGRHCIVLSRNPELVKNKPDATDESPFTATDTLASALKLAQETDRPIWVIGGGHVYRDALAARVVDHVDLTQVDEKLDIPESANVTWFPLDELRNFEVVTHSRNEEDARLVHIQYRKK